jgi:hypothetical protein
MRAGRAISAFWKLSQPLPDSARKTYARTGKATVLLRGLWRWWRIPEEKKQRKRQGKWENDENRGRIKKLSLCLTNQALRHEDVWGSGCVDPSFLDFGTTRWWVVIFTSLPLYLRGKSPWYLLDRRLGGPQNRSGRRGGEKILDPTGTRTLTPRPSSL